MAPLKDSDPFFIEDTGRDLTLFIKKSFSRKLYGTISFHLIFVSAITAILMFTPLARFYVNENEWLLHLNFAMLFLTYIAMFFKRDEYNMNIILLILSMLLQISTAAIFVTYYDLLGVLQGLFLTASAISLLFLYLLLCRRSCDLCMALPFSFVIILVAAALFQMIFGCTSEELIISVVFSTCLSIYYLYSIYLVIHSISGNKYFVGVIYINVWPVIALISKENLLTLK
ncbi:uncharacterized protein LOC129963798 [Argiope bruennichi]|uniref:uncharacterized protein LOC129963798 n=1 Tax=Argiope bruennichi TaxID=94029 RepID=UPI00249543CB|nr:uncharacterized protein LOC129963798 [Argiope bruennichi]XP_055934335.1 uncharacterized protein LOC129963798 [Argiope bruennichi]